MSERFRWRGRDDGSRTSVCHKPPADRRGTNPVDSERPAAGSDSPRAAVDCRDRRSDRSIGCDSHDRVVGGESGATERPATSCRVGSRDRSTSVSSVDGDRLARVVGVLLGASKLIAVWSIPVVCGIETGSSVSERSSCRPSGDSNWWRSGRSVLRPRSGIDCCRGPTGRLAVEPLAPVVDPPALRTVPNRWREAAGGCRSERLGGVGGAEPATRSAISLEGSVAGESTHPAGAKRRTPAEDGTPRDSTTGRD